MSFSLLSSHHDISMIMNSKTLKCLLSVHKTQEGRQDQRVEVTLDQAVGMAFSESLVYLDPLNKS